jgi:hypothetical protein
MQIPTVKLKPKSLNQIAQIKLKKAHNPYESVPITTIVKQSDTYGCETDQDPDFLTYKEQESTLDKSQIFSSIQNPPSLQSRR